MADAGSVAWNFSRKSVISVPKGNSNEEEVLLAVIDAGAEDVKSEEETIEFFQSLIDSGLVWQLQGSYGRTAMFLIEQGYCEERK